MTFRICHRGRVVRSWLILLTCMWRRKVGGAAERGVAGGVAQTSFKSPGDED